jgi:hypothetical protein
MKYEQGYEVEVSSLGRNFMYKDGQGILQFCFDVNPFSKPTVVYLSKRPLTEDFKLIEWLNLSQIKLSWIKQARERVIQHLISTGVQVEDDERNEQ